GARGGATRLGHARPRSHDGGRSRRPSLEVPLREIVEDRAEQLVEPFGARDAQLLAGGMHADDLGADRDHLDPGELLAEHGALEPAVHDPGTRCKAEEALEALLRGREKQRVESWLPRRIGAAYLDLGAAETPERFQLGHELVERDGVRAPGHRSER